MNYYIINIYVYTMYKYFRNENNCIMMNKLYYMHITVGLLTMYLFDGVHTHNYKHRFNSL